MEARDLAGLTETLAALAADPSGHAELAKALFLDVSPGKNWPLAVLAALFASPREVWDLYSKYCQLLDEKFFGKCDSVQNGSDFDIPAPSFLTFPAPSFLTFPAPSFLTFVNRRATNGFWKPLPLHMAAYWGHTGTVKALLDLKAGPHTWNGQGETALDKAEHNGHEEVVKVLKEAMTATPYDGVEW